MNLPFFFVYEAHYRTYAGRENKLVANGTYFVANGNFLKKARLKEHRIEAKKRFLKEVSHKEAHENRP